MKKKERDYPPSGYRSMWLFVFFDLPTRTAEQRKLHTKFRKSLERIGFVRSQLSVYVQFYPNQDSSDRSKQSIKGFLPPAGEVRLLTVTDRQFEKMQILRSQEIVEVEKKPKTAMFF